MSKAIEIIERALNSIGVHSVISPADPSLIEDSLPYLQSVLAELKALDIILEETVDDDVVTIDSPSQLTDELNEPKASTIHIVNILAIDISPVARVPHSEVMSSVRNRAINRLSAIYRQHTFDMNEVDTTLPRGAGNRNSSVYFSDSEKLK